MRKIFWIIFTGMTAEMWVLMSMNFPTIFQAILSNESFSFVYAGLEQTIFFDPANDNGGMYLVFQMQIQTGYYDRIGLSTKCD